MLSVSVAPDEHTPAVHDQALSVSGLVEARKGIPTARRLCDAHSVHEHSHQRSSRVGGHSCAPGGVPILGGSADRPRNPPDTGSVPVIGVEHRDGGTDMTGATRAAEAVTTLHQPELCSRGSRTPEVHCDD